MFVLVGAGVDVIESLEYAVEVGVANTVKLAYELEAELNTFDELDEVNGLDEVNELDELG